jgi:hypothetical protein
MTKFYIILIYYTFPSYIILIGTPPHSLKNSNANLKVKTMEEERIGVRSLARNILGVEGHVGDPRWGLGQMTSGSIIHMDLHKTNKKLIIM